MPTRRSDLACSVRTTKGASRIIEVEFLNGMIRKEDDNHIKKPTALFSIVDLVVEKIVDPTLICLSIMAKNIVDLLSIPSAAWGVCLLESSS